MNIKVVVYNKNHLNTIRFPNKKELKENKIVVGNNTYLITENDHFQLTKRWWGAIKHHVTYYYREGDPIALDVPNFHSIDAAAAEGAEKVERLTSEELNEVFNPAFYRMVRGRDKNTKADLQYYMIIGILLISVFVAWRTNSIWSLIKDLIPGGN